jgi:hypothetical protein
VLEGLGATGAGGGFKVLETVMLLRVIDDSSICHPEDVWGNGPDNCPLGELGPEDAFVRDNPDWVPAFHACRPKYTEQMLLNIALSHNDKTRVCFSEWFGPSRVRDKDTGRMRANLWGTCAWATELCRMLCYGHSARISSPKPRGVYQINSAQMRELPDEAVPALGDAMVHTCQIYGLENLRWHGVGDLNPFSDRVAVYIATRYPKFTIWGFTRSAPRLLGLLEATGGVRKNMLFWCSVDVSTTVSQLERLCEVARECGTGLAFFSTCGERFTTGGKRLKTQPIGVEWADDEGNRSWIWEAAADYGVQVHVCFGYHGASKRTFLDIDRECPATNPHGDGHEYEACQKCGHCSSRRDVGSWKRTITLKGMK